MKQFLLFSVLLVSAPGIQSRSNSSDSIYSDADIYKSIYSTSVQILSHAATQDAAAATPDAAADNFSKEYAIHMKTSDTSEGEQVQQMQYYNISSEQAAHIIQCILISWHHIYSKLEHAMLGSASEISDKLRDIFYKPNTITPTSADDIAKLRKIDDILQNITNPDLKLFFGQAIFQGIHAICAH